MYSNGKITGIHSWGRRAKESINNQDCMAKKLKSIENVGYKNDDVSKCEDKDLKRKERNVKLNLATWNVRGSYVEGAMKEVINQMQLGVGMTFVGDVVFFQCGEKMKS